MYAANSDNACKNRNVLQIVKTHRSIHKTKRGFCPEDLLIDHFNVLQTFSFLDRKAEQVELNFIDDLNLKIAILCTALILRQYCINCNIDMGEVTCRCSTLLTNMNGPSVSHLAETCLRVVNTYVHCAVAICRAFLFFLSQPHDCSNQKMS